jgi:hypothetical protein
MTYTGHVEKGVVVFDGPKKPAEGTAVVVAVRSRRATRVGEGLARLAGKAKGLPADLSEHHDKYRRERRAS